MDNQLEWKEEFDIGVKIIDEEHRRLFKISTSFLLLEKRKGKVGKHARKESNILKSMR